MQKITKRDNFMTIANILAASNHPDLEAVMLHEIELLDKKNANRSDKPTKAQIENAEIAERLPTLLEPNRYYRLSEIKELVPELVNASGTQRIAVICNRLEKENILTKVIEKRVVYYALAE